MDENFNFLNIFLISNNLDVIFQVIYITLKLINYINSKSNQKDLNQHSIELRDNILKNYFQLFETQSSKKNELKQIQKYCSELIGINDKFKYFFQSLKKQKKTQYNNANNEEEKEKIGSDTLL